MAKVNGLLIYGGGTLSFLNLLYFAWGIWSGTVAPTNTSSWLMWTLLDIAVLRMMIASGKPFTLPLSYTLGSAVVLLVHVQLGPWAWTWVESFSAFGVVVSVILWRKLSADYGIIACVSAMTIAGIPLTFTLWASPDPRAFWMFANTAIACAMTLVGSRPRTVGAAALSISGLVYGVTVALITLR